ncbi:MBL fold metallo-hydrolase [Flavobacterium sp. H122]|uniref:MBL fold metallo-hydrolase n=1 Tax=Flavobacterium sp. H122 TaxID=2529860 RepID=UPI0010AA8954|nr:MBL fold metallo-hydrolase [Flavobacterium sp. H122]
MEVKTFRVSNFSIINQCYLIYKNDIGILVDPAWDYNLINNFLVDNQIGLKCILLTHSHQDHTNLAQEFSKKHNVPVFMSAIEIEDYEFDCLNLKAVDHLKEITIATFRIIPILTPGHTSGSVCYLIDKHLFSGDTIFIEGVGICIDKGSDPNQMYDSVQFIKKHIPKKTLFWPGHSFGQSPGKNLDFLLMNNIYFQLDNREHFVNFRMRKNSPNPFKFT